MSSLSKKFKNITCPSFVTDFLIHNYKINKNKKGQNSHINFYVNISRKWVFYRKKKRYEFFDSLKIFEVLKFYNRLFHISKISETVNSTVLFVSDSIGLAFESHVVANAAKLARQSFFLEHCWTPGHITSAWWAKKDHTMSLIVLPTLESSLRYWHESQNLVIPLLSVGPVNANVSKKVSYPTLGSFENNFIQIYFITRFLGIVFIKK